MQLEAFYENLNFLKCYPSNFFLIRQNIWPCYCSRPWSIYECNYPLSIYNQNELLLIKVSPYVPAVQKKKNKKKNESYKDGSFFRRSLSCIYVITAWMLITILNISAKKTEWNLYVPLTFSEIWNDFNFINYLKGRLNLNNPLSDRNGTQTHSRLVYKLTFTHFSRFFC